MLLFTLFSPSVLLVFSLYLGTCVLPLFSVNPIFLLIYFSFSHISTFILTQHTSYHDTCFFLYLKKVAEGTCLAVTCIVQVTSSSIQLIKPLPPFNAEATCYPKLETSPTITDSLSSYPSFNLERLRVL